MLKQNEHQAITWDEILEDIMCLKAVSNSERIALLRKQVKKTVLKDESILLDLSELDGSADYTPEFIITEIAQVKYCHFLKAISFSTQNLTQFPEPSINFQRSLVILNLSKINNPISFLSSYGSFESLMFLNLSNNNLKTI